MSNFKLKQNGAQVQKAIDYAMQVPQLSEAIADQQTQLDGKQPIGNYLTEVPDEYVTEDELEAEITDLKAQGLQQIPLFANDISECTDTTKVYVLPDGYIYAYMKTTTTTEGSKVPNFTNLLEVDGAYTKDGYRYSQSSAAWKAVDGAESYVVPIPMGTVTLRIKNYYCYSGYQYLYAGTTNETFPGSVGDQTAGSDFLTSLNQENKEITLTFSNSSYKYVTFVSKKGYVEIVTANEEITYTTTEGDTVTSYQWANTGYAFVPADYEDRIHALENKTNEHSTEIEDIKEALETGVSGEGVLLYLSPDGNDENDGLSANSPKKTVKACLNAGATRISAKRGIYKEAVSLTNITNLEIFPTDNDKTYISGETRDAIVFDTSDAIEVSDFTDYNSIKRATYTAESNTAFDKVFVKKTLSPTASASQSSYYATVWLFSADEKTVCVKLKPVLSVAECEAEVNTFSYVDGYIYINADFTSVDKIVVPTISETGFYVNGANNLVMREVEVRFSGEYNMDLRNCAWVDLYKCACKYTTRASGFHPVDTNGIFRACYATKNFDGFAPNSHGHTTYIDCVSEYNFDDGMSHHAGTEGTVIGGRFEGNGKGGNIPSYGAKVNIYGGLYKDNVLYGICYTGDTDRGYASGTIQGTVMAGNPTGLTVHNGCELTAIGCTYNSNANDKDIQGTLVEYDTINDDSSNGNGGGSGGFDKTFEFVDSVDDFTDINKLYVLPDGGIYTYTYATGNVVTPNFTNLMNLPGAYIKDGYRYSHSSAAFKECASDCAIIVPVTMASSYTIRTRGGSYTGCSYPNSVYFSTNNTAFPIQPVSTATDWAVWGTDSNGDTYITIKKAPTTTHDYVVFHVASGVNPDSLIVTLNEEIAYKVSEDVTDYQWVNSGYSLVTEEYTKSLEEKIGSLLFKSSGTAFSVPAYAPTPQLPADGSEGSDFNYKTTTTQDAYDYMDALCNKYTQYITKQTMGKDASGQFDHNRYILSKAYWRAWQKENYPRMFAWQNGSTVIYSVSVSPRVGDTMYSTPYVGTAYSTVTAVNSAEHTASTRTVNSKVFIRNEAGDVEPTIAYTKPPQYPGNLATATVYNSSYGSLTEVSTVGSDYIIGADGIKYIRYPFEDRKQDKTKLMSIFMLSNEHGNYGDDLIPSFVVMRMAKDLCRNTENPFLKWLKENCIITMIPVGNPWGYARYLASGNTSGYCNSNAVNINRNYDTPGWETSNTDPQGGTKEDGAFGAYPGSEIETQHIMNTMQMCKPKVGISMHSPGFAPQYKDMPDNAYFIHQGQGYDAARIHKITEALYSNYGMGGSADVGSIQHYENCGKSPAYIQYVGAVGGLTETVTQENGTNNIYTSIAMEQAYSQMLLFLQTWCEEALEKQDA